jgi:hypothetical protein
MSEPTGQNLTLKIDIPQSSLTSALADGVRTKLLTGAVEYIVRELKQEDFQILVNEIFAESLKNMESWELRKRVDAVITPMLDEVLQRPEILSFLRRKVEEGVNQALEELPNEVKVQVIKKSVEGMVRAWGQRER